MSWSYDLTNTLKLIKNPDWSNEVGAYITPKEIDSDASGNIYILGAVVKPNTSGPFPNETTFLGNSLTILSSTGLHIRTIEVTSSTYGNSTTAVKTYLATSSSGKSLINTTKKAFLIDEQGSITTLIDEPLVANQWEYVDQLRSAIYFNGNFYLQHGGNILKYSEEGVLLESIDSGWDNVAANTQGDGIEFDVKDNLISVAFANCKQGSTNKGETWVLSKSNDTWTKSTSLDVGHTAISTQLNSSGDSYYVVGEGPGAGDGYIAKYTKNESNEWEQTWFKSDSESYIFHKLDITSNGDILVKGRTGGSGFTAIYDSNGNQLEKYTDQSLEAKSSIDFEKTTTGIGFIRKVDNKWIAGVNSNYPDNKSVPAEVVTTYSVSTSSTSINEGSTFTTSISTTNIYNGTTLYYSLSGTGITSEDFSSGALTGSETVDGNGDFSFSHTLASNGITEGIEILEIKLFSDSSRTTQVGTTSFIDIKDTSNDESTTKGAGSTWQYVNSRTTTGSVGNQVGKITLNNDGTIAVTGSYTSDLNSDQTAAINGGGFQKYSQVDMECTQHKEVMDHY